MIESKLIDAFMIQETHLEGDFVKILPKGQLFIHHGPNVQPHQGAKRGVMIILSPEMGTNWKWRKCNKKERDYSRRYDKTAEY